MSTILAVRYEFLVTHIFIVSKKTITTKNDFLPLHITCDNEPSK